MLVDETNLTITAGHGGPGKVSFKPGFKSGPDGGNGGKGGDVYIEATTDLMALQRYIKNKSYKADNGEPGGSNNKSGSNGKDLTLIMPVGSLLLDKDTGEKFELLEDGQKILIAKGGFGGRGNFEFRSSLRTTPMFAQPGLPGQERNLEINLRLIAQYGLIGLPNAGKSSLLNELTNASAKVGDYPFTTLEPNLGVLNGKIIADIPGLIEGASEGKGLGTRFLKHIEKVEVLLHCIAADSKDPVLDYKLVVNELKNYSSELSQKRQVILITKSDLVDEKTLDKTIKAVKKLKLDYLPVSIHDFESIEKLKELLTRLPACRQTWPGGQVDKS